MRPKPDDFGGGNDLGPIHGSPGWWLSAWYTLLALGLVVLIGELLGWMLPLIASVIGP